MRRATALVSLIVAALWIATPAQAFAHNNVHSTTLHTVLDALTLLVVSAPVWTALLWAGGSKWWLAGLVAVVQIPVAVIAFVPIVNPYLHLTLFLIAIAVTAVALRLVRDHARAAAVRPAPTPR